MPAMIAREVCDDVRHPASCSRAVSPAFCDLPAERERPAAMTTRHPEADESDLPGIAPSDEDVQLLVKLRAGDEASFSLLIERYHAPLLRLAQMYVQNRAAAEEAVQETWLGVIQGLDRFEGRSSLKTWIFRILTNRAKTKGEREGRTIPFSAAFSADADPGEAAVDPSRFHPAEHERWPGHWTARPANWDEMPEDRLLARETHSRILAAVEALPPSQREVITLRDIDGWTSDEVCNVLGITETNQRVLLHRARSKVRRALEQYLEEQQG
jgi:RNA polymerase sigma-70 factor, ECF subfamily